MKMVQVVRSAEDCKSNLDVDVVYVDDNPAEAHLFENAISKLNEKPRCAWVQDSKLFLEMLSDKCFEGVRLFILDLQMPGVNGFECKEKINQIDHYKMVPAMVMSNSSEKRDIKKAYGLNFNAYLVKEADLNSFRKKIGNAIEFWTRYNCF